MKIEKKRKTKCSMPKQLIKLQNAKNFFMYIETCILIG